MPLHLLKLCVGAESIQDLAEWQDSLKASFRKARKTPRIVHTTRMVPKRIAEIVSGGSLYWVIKGHVCVRQRITAIEPFTDAEGIGRCHLVLDPALVAVVPRPKRPFQGWRYLAPQDAPQDLPGGAGDGALTRELAELGLL